MPRRAAFSARAGSSSTVRNEQIMQKLVTIYLDNAAYSEGKFISNPTKCHLLVEEHLREYLSEGWKICSLTGFGGGADSVTSVRGWLGVVLEK